MDLLQLKRVIVEDGWGLFTLRSVLHLVIDFILSFVTTLL